jgi:hypothetical protein
MSTRSKPDRSCCAEIKAGRDCPVHGKVHGPTGVYTPPDWEAIVDDAVYEIDQRWGEPVDDDETAPMDRQIVRETAEAVLRPVVAERDRLRAENEALHKRVVQLERAVCRVATIDDFYGPGGRRAAAEAALASDETQVPE